MFCRTDHNKHQSLDVNLLRVRKAQQNVLTRKHFLRNCGMVSKQSSNRRRTGHKIVVGGALDRGGVEENFEWVDPRWIMGTVDCFCPRCGQRIIFAPEILDLPVCQCK